MNHLRRPRAHKDLREFTYEKTFTKSLNKKTPKATRIAWDIKYKGEYLVTLTTLKEVFHYIQDKMDT